VVDAMALDPGQWERVRVDSAERQAQRPDGQAGTLLDNIIVLRRTGGGSPTGQNSKG